jgi:hypothetical protein
MPDFQVKNRDRLVPRAGARFASSAHGGFPLMHVLAPEVSSRAATIPDSLIPEDPFHDRRLKWVWVSFAVMLLAGVVVLSAVYLGSAYGVPSWSAASVPAPVSHTK